MSPAMMDHDLHMKVPKADFKAWKRIAEAERMTVSDWIRRTLYEAARHHDIGSKIVDRKKAKR